MLLIIHILLVSIKNKKGNENNKTVTRSAFFLRMTNTVMTIAMMMMIKSVANSAPTATWVVLESVLLLGAADGEAEVDLVLSPQTAFAKSGIPYLPVLSQ